MENLGKITWGFFIMAFMIVLHGWVFTTVFNWLAVPLFDVTAITLLHGIVIRFLWGTVDSSTYTKRKFKQTLDDDNQLDDAQTITYWIMRIVIIPSVILLTAWVISLFI